MKIEVKVQPNSGRQKIKKISDSEYKIFLKKPAEDNKANLELNKLLKKTFGPEAKIIRGFASKRKVVEIKHGN